MPRALIALGSNLGDRQRLLDRAVERLAATNGVNSVRASSWNETQPVGGPADQPPFLNGSAVVETSLSPELLLARLEQIEQELGRNRSVRWGPRTIDLDLLLFDEIVMHTPKLVLPHPRMALRRFVLEPAAEVAPSMLHPTFGWTVAQLLDHLRTAAPYVAISGAIQSDTASQLATALADKHGLRRLNHSHIPPIDSPSLTLSWAIEFLRQQAQLLARHKWPESSPGAISPFWIEDVLALGDVLWPDALDNTWKVLSPTVVPPKLLVMLSEPSPPQDDQSLFQRLAVAVRIRASRKGVGPVLWLESADLPAAESELFAAIESMN